MRLKEPLQGISMMQGHFVMHFSMFFASNIIHPDLDMPDFKKLYPSYDAAKIKEKEDFWTDNYV